MKGDQFFPLRENTWVVVNKDEKLLKSGHLTLNFGYAQPQAIGGCRTSGDGPEFVNVLRNDAQIITSMLQLVCCINSQGMLRIGSVGKSNKDVCIYEDLHPHRPS